MFLHVEDEVISLKDVIAIFNLQDLIKNKVNNNFLFKIDEKKKSYKTILLTSNKGKIKEYFSNISAQTISKNIEKSSYKILEL